MGNYTILYMLENPRRSRQARNFTTNAPKILDLKSSSEQICSRKLPLGAPESSKVNGRASVAMVSCFVETHESKANVLLTFSETKTGILMK